MSSSLWLSQFGIKLSEDQHDQWRNLWDRLYGCILLFSQTPPSVCSSPSFADRARDLSSNEIVAVKKLKLCCAQTLHERSPESSSLFPLSAIREINLLLRLHHPNVASIREVVVARRLDQVYLVMDCMDQDLASMFQHRRRSFSLSQCKNLILQLLRGVDYLHSHWIVHRYVGGQTMPGEAKLIAHSLSSVHLSEPCASKWQQRSSSHITWTWGILDCLHVFLFLLLFFLLLLFRDLTPSNLLYSRSRALLKISDFGLARQFGSPLRAMSGLLSRSLIAFCCFDRYHGLILCSSQVPSWRCGIVLPSCFLEVLSTLLLSTCGALVVSWPKSSLVECYSKEMVKLTSWCKSVFCESGVGAILSLSH